MEMHPVKSSNIAAVGHDPLVDVLRVAYKDGRQYDFPGIPSTTFDQLLAAESKGKFIGALGIKGTRVAEFPEGDDDGEEPQPLDVLPDEGCCGTAARRVDLSKKCEWRCARCGTLWRVISEEGSPVRHWEATPELLIW